MSKKTTPTSASETKSAEPMASAPVAAPATGEQGGVTAQSAEALAEGTTAKTQPAETKAESAPAGEAAPATETPAPITETAAPTKTANQKDSEDSDEVDPDGTEATEIIETLDSLALRYRVPSWKQAAMLQMQGWAPGKRVSAAVYETALADLGSRPLGGGARR